MYSKTRFNIVGFSLIELLVSVVLICIFTLCLNQFYLSSRKILNSYSIQHQHHVSANKVFMVVNDAVAKAGRVGCKQVSNGIKVMPSHGQEISVTNSLLVDSGRLHVVYQNYPNATLLDSISSSVLRVDVGAWLQTGQFLVVSDCEHAEIFKAAHVSRMSDHQFIRTEEPLKYAYQKGAEVSKLISHDVYADGGLRVKDNLSGWVHRSVFNIFDLHFLRRGNGVEYRFKTVVNGFEKRWLGYAGMS